MRYYGSQSLAIGISILDIASAAAISSNSIAPYSNFTLHSSTDPHLRPSTSILGTISTSSYLLSTNIPLSMSSSSSNSTTLLSSSISPSSVGSPSNSFRLSSTGSASSPGPSLSSISIGSLSAGPHPLPKSSLSSVSSKSLPGATRSLSTSSSSSIFLPTTGSINSTSTLPGVTLQIITSIIIQSGITVTEPIITGGGLSSPITLPPVTTTIVSSQATSSVSSVSSQIASLIPVISSWKANPTLLKSDTLAKVKGVKGDVERLISDLGSDSSSKPCGSKKKRGLLGLISDVVSTLSCIDDDLDNVTDKINADDVEDIENTLDDLKSENNDLTDDGDNNSNSMKNSDSSTDSSTSSETSSETSSSSSCGSTETELRVTVLCIPTTFTTSGSTVSTTTCSPTTTVTTSGCSITGTTTTVSVTSSSVSSSATLPVCAPDTCGSLCPMGTGPLSGATIPIVATDDCSFISTSTTSVLPSASYGVVGSIAVVSPTPSGSNDPSKRELPVDAMNYNKTHVDGSDSLVQRALPEVSPPYADYVSQLSKEVSERPAGDGWISQAGATSGHFYLYNPKYRRAVGVSGIYGCTAVIITSVKGVYLSHIWENPVFIGDDGADTDNDFFVANSFNALRDSAPDTLSVAALVGTDDQPGVLNALYSPKVFVITPFTTDDERISGITTVLRYQARANWLGEKLSGIVPGSDGYNILGYTRVGREMATQATGIFGRAIFEVDPYQTWLAKDNGDPKSSGLAIGRWRLWVADQLITYQDFWQPNVPPPTGNIQQRDIGYSNPCMVYTDNSTSSVPFSASTAFPILNSATTASIPSPISADSTQISSITTLATQTSTSSYSGPSSTSNTLTMITTSTTKASKSSNSGPSSTGSILTSITTSATKSSTSSSSGPSSSSSNSLIITTTSSRSSSSPPSIVSTSVTTTSAPSPSQIKCKVWTACPTNYCNYNGAPVDCVNGHCTCETE